MPDPGERLRTVLDGYAKFLRNQELPLPKHQPYLVRWVQRFFAFASQHPGYMFGQTLDMSLAEVGGRVGVKAWQIQQGAVLSQHLCAFALHPSPSAPLRLRALALHPTRLSSRHAPAATRRSTPRPAAAAARPRGDAAFGLFTGVFGQTGYWPRNP